MELELAWIAAAAGLIGWVAPKATRRVQLSRAKHRSLAGHSRLAKRLSEWLPAWSYDEDRFFSIDGAPPEVAARRKAALERLSQAYSARYPKGAAMTDRARLGLPDLAFTSRYRVPFQFSPLVGAVLKSSSFVERSDGVTVTDVDGNVLFDVAGSYGVNLLGYDFYKGTIAQAVAEAGSLGPVLGSYHPALLEVIDRLKAISGLDAVSFHMSGTEAVMQAVRLARYHTGRTHLVRFCGAYHGWWEDVQPGPGNPSPHRETYTLRDMDERSLKVLRTRRDIACVLVNPLQALHPNSPAPGDSSLVDSGRRAGFDREGYSRWLRRLREVCTERGIVLIFDEVFLGFRLAPGGAQSYFGVSADMVTYGKTLGGGFPVGVVCGRSEFMKRYRDDRPTDICFARGTFNAHPYVICAMRAFLRSLDQPEVQSLYEGLDERWLRRADHLNQRFEAAGLPVRVSSLSTVWTVTYTQPSRYNWMLQYYLRLHDLALSWVGSGRMIFSLNYTDEDFEAVSVRFLAAASQMKQDGWWDHVPESNRDIRRGILKEMLSARFGVSTR
ncbi:MAG: aminotransferase class III-fold pyridoxal phosphate-dependent enzyme [Burkholderiales bacterium]